jgi:hypothetical protein
MNLAAWLKLRNIPPNVFAKRIGKNKSMIHKYIHWGVIPQHDIIVKIFKATAGAVTANDFHGLYNNEELGKKADTRKARKSVNCDTCED